MVIMIGTVWAIIGFVIVFNLMKLKSALLEIISVINGVKDRKKMSKREVNTTC